MSLLTLIQGVCGVLSLAQPSAVVGSTDRQVLQLFALANEEGRDLASACAWQALVEEQTFVTVATPAQATAVPADFDRFIPNSFFNRSTRREMTGPITPRQWQWIQAQPVYSTAFLMFRERTGQFLISPTPPAGQTIAYEYVSKNWCKSASNANPANNPQAAYAADADVAYLDETLMALGLRWRFLRAKGLDYAEEMATYERQKEQAIARDGGASALTMSPQPIDMNRVNLPDGNFGG